MEEQTNENQGEDVLKEADITVKSISITQVTSKTGASHIFFEVDGFTPLEAIGVLEYHRVKMVLATRKNEKRFEKFAKREKEKKANEGNDSGSDKGEPDSTEAGKQ